MAWEPLCTNRFDLDALLHPALVSRESTATAPKQLWVVDLTVLAT
ncbi:hypothetical protein [uncultured Mycobacterium sp.]